MTTEKDKPQKIPAILAAMGKVIKEIGAISKDQTNTFQHYNYRGIDDLCNRLHPLFAEHGIIVLPRTVSHSYDRQEGRKQPDHAIIEIAFDFMSSIDGSRETSGPFIGEGFDNGDKAFNKAQSAAMKVCLLQTFVIPTEGELLDSENGSEPNTTEKKPKKSKPPQGKPPASKTDQIDEFVNGGAKLTPKQAEDEREALILAAVSKSNKLEFYYKRDQIIALIKAATLSAKLPDPLATKADFTKARDLVMMTLDEMNTNRKDKK